MKYEIETLKFDKMLRMISMLFYRGQSTPEQKSFERDLAKRLTEFEYSVSIRDIPINEITLSNEKKRIIDTDVVIISFPIGFDETNINRTARLLDAVRDFPAVHLVCLSHEQSQMHFASDLVEIRYLLYPDFSITSREKLVSSLVGRINQEIGDKISSTGIQNAQAVKEAIEDLSPSYIDETKKSLNTREKDFKILAMWCYGIGLALILIGVVIATILLFQEKGTSESKDWEHLTFFTLKSIFIIALLLSASKYCYSLGKSYMSESLKIADRVHAMSFGEFYITVFNRQITPADVKEVFQNWNIDTKTNSFASQTADYDPKLIEKIIELIEKVRGGSKG